MIEAVANRHIIYNRTLDEIAKEEEAGRLFVIRPEKPIPVSRVEKDPEKLKQAYALGRAAMEKKMAALTAYLQN